MNSRPFNTFRLATIGGSLAAFALAAHAAPKAVPAMQQVLNQLKSYNAPPLPTLTPGNARNAPSAADAAMETASKQGKPTFMPVGDIFHRAIPGPGGKGQILVRFYKPLNAPHGPLPMLVYFHGGGFVIANLDTYDASCRALADGAGCMVASVAYRQAPEHPFPAAPEDCYAATQYLTRHAAMLGANPKKIAVAGESAGGNLATVVCMMAKDRHGMMPIHQLLVYPYILNSRRLSDAKLNHDFPSYKVNADAIPLGKPVGKWFWKYYVPNGMERPTRYAEPIRATRSQLRGLPPATIIGAQIDALQSEGIQYATHLRSAGVSVNYKLYNGVTHEFFGMGGVVPEAKSAEGFAAAQLKAAFSR